MRKDKSKGRAAPKQMQSLGFFGILAVAVLLAMGGWYAGFYLQDGFNATAENLLTPEGQGKYRENLVAPPPPPPMDFNR